jgi:hypothetical protein
MVWSLPIVLPVMGGNVPAMPVSCVNNKKDMHKNAAYRFFIGIRLGCKTAVPSGLRLLDLKFFQIYIRYAALWNPVSDWLNQNDPKAGILFCN